MRNLAPFLFTTFAVLLSVGLIVLVQRNELIRSKIAGFDWRERIAEAREDLMEEVDLAG